MWTRARMIAVGGGGATGAAARWAAVDATAGHGVFPWPVLVLNGVGSFLLGLVLAEEWAHPRARVALHDFAGIGFCGGLTTFSTFAVEVVDLVDRGHPWMAAGYVAASVGLSVFALVAGAGVLRRVRALAVPLEEQP